MIATVGTIDRIARIVPGIGLIAASLMSVIGPRGFIGIIPLATGAFRFCPAFRLFGLSTCPMASR